MRKKKDTMTLVWSTLKQWLIHALVHIEFVIPSSSRSGQRARRSRFAILHKRSGLYKWLNAKTGKERNMQCKVFAQNSLLGNP